MAIARPPNSFEDEILDFLASGRTSEEVIAFEPSEALKSRSSELFERNRQSTLTAEEKVELDDFLRMNHFVNMLKIRARKKAAKS